MLIKNASKKICVVMSSNYSYLILKIFQFIKELKNINDYDSFVFEKHHKSKKDIPSGTAKK